MAWRPSWAPVARLDLSDILVYIAERNPDAARTFAVRVFDAVERLPDFPEIGRVVPEIGDPSVRELIRRPCRIVYRVRADSKEIEVARVWHARRGPPVL